MLDPCTGLLFGIIVLIILLYRKIPIWAIFLIVGFIMLLLIGKPYSILDVLYNVSIDSTTWDLIVIMYLIAVFVSLYRVTGFIDKLGKELILFLRRPRLIAMFTPAILGLLPVPGGALMSAPIVDRVGGYIGLDRIRKLFVNVWFRHVIFIVYPLSTVLILTSSLTGVDLWSIIVRQVPIALFMIFIGYVIGFPLKGSSNIYRFNKVEKPNNKLLVKLLIPMLTAIGLTITMTRFLDYRYPLPVKRLSMVLGVSIGIYLLIVLSRIELRKAIRSFIGREAIELAFIGYTAMFLRNVFQVIDLSCLTSYLSTTNPLLITILLPAILSSLVGVVSSGIALSIPILSSFIEFDVETASLIYLSAFLGYLGSPLHLCYIYTAQYLKTTIVKGYKYMIPAILLTMIITLIIYSIL
ncbi:MAG: hypothetical protein B6U89_02900 [Desulfurococcales archaeon ex4484_58]|nr:MAG: hypothetical protein B6U89_02900 [Desulfurococcales archaeon ex4484_58]